MSLMMLSGFVVFSLHQPESFELVSFGSSLTPPLEKLAAADPLATFTGQNVALRLPRDDHFPNLARFASEGSCGISATVSRG